MIMVLLDELANLRFLRHFAPDHLRQIASIARLQEFQPEDVIFYEGEAARDVYLVLEGDVALEMNVPDRGVFRVHTVGAGELLGWSPVLGSGGMTATARALTRCRLAALDAAKIRALSEQAPQFGVDFFRRTAAALAERLRATRLHLPGALHHQAVAVREGSD
jgi:CRP-like cAMP-binding protein